MNPTSPGLLSWRSFRLALALLCGTLASVAQPSPGPELDVTLIQPEDAQSWHPTEALALRVALRHPAISSQTATRDALTLAPTGQAWPAAVSLQITGPDGREVSWPLVRSGISRVTPYPLPIGGLLSMAFVMTSDPNRRIPPGDYAAVAILEIREGTGWTGRSESPPLRLKVAAPPETNPGLEISVTGGNVLAVGDPWVVELRVLPPLGNAAENVLRSGYRFRVFDASGREQPWAFEPAVTLPRLPNAGELIESGLYPVLAVLPPTAATGLEPGNYRLEASWSGASAGKGRTNSLNVTVNVSQIVQRLPERPQAVRQQHLGWATALLWRAEYSSTAEIEQLVRKAAPLLVAAETNALDTWVQDISDSEVALALSETYFLGGDFESALAFASLARRLQVPPVESINFPPDPVWQELGEFSRLIEETAARGPGRVLPYLIPAINTVRPPDLSAPWAATARASSEYRSSDYGAAQATGAPNVSRHGDNPRAWATKTADAGDEWIELSFATAIRARGVRVIQSFNPGAVVRIDVIFESGAATTIWTGPDRTIYPRGEIGILEVSFPPTEQPVNGVKVILDTRIVAGWNEIDAVQLLAARASTTPPRLQFQVSSTAPRILEFSPWPKDFILQRATRISPADWTTFSLKPPAGFVLEGEAAYFRLVRAP